MNQVKARRELPLLAGIAGLIRWVEELANLLSGPLLTVGLGIALVDLLTEGKLLASVPLLLYAWAISQAVGVDAQLVALWDKAHLALRERRYGALLAHIVLGLILAYVAWIAAQVFALQESEGLTTSAALSRLGMDSALWLVQRTALSVFLVCLAGWTRYHPPAADVAADAAAERARLEADLQLEPLRQEKRAMQARGLRSVAAAMAGREVPPPSPSSPRPPTGGGSPTRQRGVITPATMGATIDAPNITPLRPPDQTTPGRRRAPVRHVARNKSANNRTSVEAKARRHYAPGMSASELARTARIGKSAASKYARLLAAEHEQAVQ